MDEIVKMLDENLVYINHEIVNDVYYINVKSNRDKVICPFCNTVSNNPHSFYKRTFQDLPIQGKKVIIHLKNRKMYCKNPDCSHTTFAERFDFINNNARKSERTKEKIMDISLNCSSVAASHLLKKVSIDVGKSTICNMIKKKRLMSKKKM